MPKATPIPMTTEQVIAALERHADELSQRLGLLDPERARLRLAYEACLSALDVLRAEVKR